MSDNPSLFWSTTDLQQRHQQHYRRDYRHNSGNNADNKHLATARHTDTAVGTTLHTRRHRHTTLGADYHLFILGIDIVRGCAFLTHNLRFNGFAEQRY